MKINIIEVPTPMVKSFTMFAEPKLSILTETKKVRVTCRQQTKTRISTDMQFGDFCVNINQAIENIKTHSETKMSYADYKNHTSHYFVKSKIQGVEKYKEYVEKVIRNIVVNHFNLELDELTIELELSRF
jgi:hypothetical protein